LALYLQYKGGTLLLDDFLRYLKRHVLMRVRKEYLKRARVEVCEDLVQAVMVELWLLVEKGTIPTLNAALYHGFLNTVIRRRIAKTFNEVYDDAPKNLDPSRYLSEYCGRIPGSDEDDLRILRCGLPEVLMDRILAKRWSPHDLPAVRYILEQTLVYKEDIVYPLMKRQYKIRDPQFLVNRVLILLRHEMYKVREDLKFNTTSEKKDSLHESFSECYPTE